MPIPNAESAFIPAEKLDNYLLNPAHPVGGPEARCFIALGYEIDEPGRLESNLVEVVRTSDDYVVDQTRFGVKYTVRGQIESPNGRRANVRTVWIVEADALSPVW
jgi:hypothetical protein